MISFVVPAYNSGKFLDQCLFGISQQRETEWECVIVVNGSSDNTELVAQSFADKDGRFSVIRFSSPLGYGRACNIGASKTRGDILFFVNDDCVLSLNTGQVAERIIALTDVGAVQPIILNKSGDKYDTAGHFLSRGGFLADVGRGAPYVAGLGAYRLFGAAGAAFAVRRSTFTALEGFDESLVFLFEETDLCWRIHRMGEHVIGTGEMYARHQHLSRYSEPDELTVQSGALYFETRSRLRCMMKNADSLVDYVGVLIQVFFRFLCSCTLFLQGDRNGSLSVLAAITWNGTHIRSTYRARKEQKRIVIVSNEQLVQEGLIAPQLYPRLGRRTVSGALYATTEQGQSGHGFLWRNVIKRGSRISDGTDASRRLAEIPCDDIPVAGLGYVPELGQRLRSMMQDIGTADVLLASGGCE